MPDPYKPIDCGVYDQLEVLAMRRTPCVVEFRDDDGSEETIEGPIVDVFSKAGEEFVKLSGDRFVRLDHLVRINGQAISGSCEIPQRGQK